MQTDDIILKPAYIFAFFKSLPFIMAALVFLLLAWCLSPFFLFFSIILVGMAWYRFMYIRTSTYTISAEVIRISRGIFFKRTDQLEMFRIKDYIVTQSFLMQLFHLMDLTLKGTDPENPVIWLRGIPESNMVDTIRNHVNEARQHNRLYEIN